MSATARKEEWPELVGLTAEEGQRKITEEIPGVCVQAVPPSGFVTMDYRVDRVRIYVDSSRKIKSAPSIGSACEKNFVIEVKAGRYAFALRAPEDRCRSKRFDLWIGKARGQPDEIPSRSTRRPQLQLPEFEPDLPFPEGMAMACSIYLASLRVDNPGYGARMLLGSSPPDMKMEWPEMVSLLVKPAATKRREDPPETQIELIPPRCFLIDNCRLGRVKCIC